MEETLKVLNRMEREGVIGRYAIGGAIAASYYVEPSVTYDLDVFTIIESEGLLVDLSGVFSWLAQHGYAPKGGGVLIGDWEVQFLMPGGRLEETALAEAREVVFGETPTRVFSAEHLALIMAKVGRPKDFARLAQFVEEEVVTVTELRRLAQQFGLSREWARVESMVESDKN